ncbi:MAG: hypothetical protein WBG04_12275 [Haloferula sp.]
MHIRHAIFIISLGLGSLHADQLDVEKNELKFSFIKLTDGPPLSSPRKKASSKTKASRSK